MSNSYNISHTDADTKPILKTELPSSSTEGTIFEHSFIPPNTSASTFNQLYSTSPPIPSSGTTSSATTNTNTTTIYPITTTTTTNTTSVNTNTSPLITIVNPSLSSLTNTNNNNNNNNNNQNQNQNSSNYFLLSSLSPNEHTTTTTPTTAAAAAAGVPLKINPSTISLKSYTGSGSPHFGPIASNPSTSSVSTSPVYFITTTSTTTTTSPGATTSAATTSETHLPKSVSAPIPQLNNTILINNQQPQFQHQRHHHHPHPYHSSRRSSFQDPDIESVIIHHDNSVHSTHSSPTFRSGSATPNEHSQRLFSRDSLSIALKRNPGYIEQKGGSPIYRWLEPVRRFLDKFMDTAAPLTKDDFPERFLDYTSEEAEDIVIPYIMELGKALKKCGMPAHRLAYQLDLVSRAHGLDCNFFSVSGVIFYSFGPVDSIASPLTHLITAPQGDLDMCKLSDLEQLSEEIALGNIPVSLGCDKIHEIMSRPPLYGNFLSCCSIALLAVVVGYLFRGSWWELLASGIVGIYVSLVLLLAQKYPSVGMLVGLVCGYGGALVAGAVSYFNSSQISLYLVTLAGVIILVPGLSITISFAEITLGYTVTGIARLFTAILNILQISGGIILGVRSAIYLMPSQAQTLPDGPVSVPEWAVLFVIIISAVSLTIMLQVRFRSFGLVLISCCLGIVAGRYVSPALGPDGGSFVGAFTICVLANFSTYLFRHAIASVTIFTGIILLVPGSFGIKAVWALVGVSPYAGNDAASSLGSMVITAMLLCAGLFAANALVKPHKAL